MKRHVVLFKRLVIWRRKYYRHFFTQLCWYCQPDDRRAHRTSFESMPLTKGPICKKSVEIRSVLLLIGDSLAGARRTRMHHAAHAALRLMLLGAFIETGTCIYLANLSEVDVFTKKFFSEVNQICVVLVGVYSGKMLNKRKRFRLHSVYLYGRVFFKFSSFFLLYLLM